MQSRLSKPSTLLCIFYVFWFTSQNKCLTLQPQQKTIFMGIRKKGVILILLFLACMLTGKGIPTFHQSSIEEITEEKSYTYQRREYIQESENIPMDKTVRHLYNNQIAYPQSIFCYVPTDNSLGKLLFYLPREVSLLFKSPLHTLQHRGHIWGHPLFSGRATDYYVYGLKKLLI